MLDGSHVKENRGVFGNDTEKQMGEADEGHRAWRLGLDVQSQ